MREQRRNPADRAGFALDIVEREIAFGRGVEFEDLRYRKARLEGFPDIAAQAVAAGEPEPMARFIFGRRRAQEIAAELADILEQRAVPAHDIVPEFACGKFVGQHHRAARAQHAAGRDDAADAVIDRQAIVQPVVDGSRRQSGEPAAPVQDAAMADAGGLRQAGGARGVDQQRAMVDGDGAPFGRLQRTAVHSIQDGIDARVVAVAALDPDFRRAVQIGQRGFEHSAKLLREDHMIGVRDVDAVGQRQPDQPGVDQCHDAADPGEAEPGGDVIRPGGHDEADGVAGFDPCRQRPARVTVDPLGQHPVAERALVRDQGGTVRLPFRPILDDIGEQAGRIGLDARGEFDRLQPAPGGGRLCARRRLRRWRRLFDDVCAHGEVTADPGQ